jgi:tRNA(Ile2) C34 agmatinyltransferase TiaS
MDNQTTRCKKCGKRMVPVITIAGRTDLQCISCDDPAVRWAESPAITPEETQSSPVKPRPSRLSTATP